VEAWQTAQKFTREISQQLDECLDVRIEHQEEHGRG